MNFTDLREGDYLPMVGVLQQLLNANGAKLEPDGIFGKQTLKAVKNYQQTNRLAVDGIVGEETWTQIAQDFELPIVDTVDIWDPTFMKEDAAYLQKVKGDPILIGGMCNGVDQVVSLLQGARNTFLLRFHGHGNSGLSGVSMGHGELDPGFSERDLIWDDPDTLKTVGRLRSIFGAYGCVEFISCMVGKGAAGHTFLQHMANKLNVPVTGAKLEQPFGRLWTFRLYGPVVTAVPGGISLSQWCKALPEFVGLCAA